MTQAPGELPHIKSPRVLVRKADRALEIYDGRRLIRAYSIALGFCPIGDKEIEGDGRTPEGDFYIAVKNPRSKYNLSLGLSYPSRRAASQGLERGIITQAEYDQIVDAHKSRKLPPQKTGLGGEIYIHGGGSAGDWTEGCIAVSDDEIEEIFAAISLGSPVTIIA